MLWSFIRPELVDAEAGAAVWPAATVRHVLTTVQYCTHACLLTSRLLHCCRLEVTRSFEKGL